MYRFDKQSSTLAFDDPHGVLMNRVGTKGRTGASWQNLRYCTCNDTPHLSSLFPQIPMRMCSENTRAETAAHKALAHWRWHAAGSSLQHQHRAASLITTSLTHGSHLHFLNVAALAISHSHDHHPRSDMSGVVSFLWYFVLRSYFAADRIGASASRPTSYNAD